MHIFDIRHLKWEKKHGLSLQMRTILSNEKNQQIDVHAVFSIVY